MIALVRTYEASMGAASQALRHHRLSPAGRQALAVLDGAGQPMSPTAIAERLFVTTASVTSLLDTLERRGLVTRSPDPDDRRKLLVAPTDTGQSTVDRVLPEIVAVQTAIMSGLTEVQRQHLLRYLAIIRDGIDGIDPDAVIAAAPARGPRRT